MSSTHTLHIANYSTVDSLLPHGKCFESKPFRAGGHRWKLCYYPNGHKDSKSGRPTAMLRLMENRFLGQAADTTANYDVSILDSDGNIVQRNSDSGTPRLYTVQGSEGGFRGIWYDIKDAATAEEQKKALRHLKDDSLIVRCDVTVKSLDEESRAKWLLRRFLQ